MRASMQVRLGQRYGPNGAVVRQLAIRNRREGGIVRGGGRGQGKCRGSGYRSYIRNTWERELMVLMGSG